MGTLVIRVPLRAFRGSHLLDLIGFDLGSTVVSRSPDCNGQRGWIWRTDSVSVEHWAGGGPP